MLLPFCYIHGCWIFRPYFERNSMMILKKNHPFIKHFLTASLTTLTLATSTNVFASDIELGREYNAVEMGNSGAGGAALVSDASTMVYNPAGLVRIPNKQLVVSGVGVFTNVKFTGMNTWSSPGLGSYTETGTAHGNANALIPAIHFSMPLTQHWFAGISVHAPFGLQTSYTNSSILRYNSTDSSLKVMDISPSIAAKINEQWSFGAGLDFEKANLIFRAMAGAPTINPLKPTAFDTKSKSTLDGWGYGWHAGALYQPSESTRFGLGFRSKVILPLHGNSDLTGPLFTLYRLPITTVHTDQTTVSLVLPATTTLSAHHDINKKWSIDGTIRYAQWSDTHRSLALLNGAGATGNINVILPHNYKNTFLFALGGTYKVSEKWLLRAGTSYDQSPVKNSERNVVEPDSNRYTLSAGTHVQPWKTVGFDFGYTHFIFEKSNVNIATNITSSTTGAISQSSVANGSFKNHGDFFAAQVVWDIV